MEMARKLCVPAWTDRGYWALKLCHAQLKWVRKSCHISLVGTQAMYLKCVLHVHTFQVHVLEPLSP